MSKPKVLFEASPMLDIKKTGVGYYMEQLISSLDQTHGSQLDMTGYYFDFLNRNNKVSPSMPGVTFKKIVYTPGKILSLCRRLRFQPLLDVFIRQSADIVLYTNYVSLPSLSSHKTAIIIYDLSFLDHPEYLQTVNLNYLQRFCPPSIKKADLIITISEFTKARILHYFPGITADIIVTPIPPAPARPAGQLNARLSGLGIKPSQYILYLGTIEPRKNIQNLVKAYSLLPETTRNQHALVLAGGKGWKDEAIHDEISRAKQRGHNIIETGYISDDEKAQLYAHSSCFVLASHYEGFGMPILEAMQYQTPVLVSDIPVFHEVAGNAAVFFDQNSPASMTSQLDALLADPARRKVLTDRGIKRLENFSWTDNANIVHQAFQSLL